MTSEIEVDAVWVGLEESAMVAVKLKVPLCSWCAGDEACARREAETGGEAAGGDRPRVRSRAAGCQKRLGITCALCAVREGGDGDRQCWWRNDDVRAGWIWSVRGSMHLRRLR